MTSPFIIAVASEKGGVGKTTIATNLAVYLKALREDLPVTIASFDNHFSVDQMFALGPRPDQDISDLVHGSCSSGLMNMGQYGVQYVASSRRLHPPAYGPEELSARLSSQEFSGILILDTRPILDWFTEAALLAADLVLTPIKDRAALINADSLRQVLAKSGREERLWLLQSLVDTRARLNTEVRVHEFLAYAAQERNYQVLDFWISKSPKVESLASGFSSALRPVLTHARNTAVHGQLKALAEFVLRRFDIAAESLPVNVEPSLVADGVAESPTSHRWLRTCPVCSRPVEGASGYFFFDMRSRRRGYLHPACYNRLLDELSLRGPSSQTGLLGMMLDGPGLVAREYCLTVCLCADDGGFADTESLDLQTSAVLRRALPLMTGRPLEEAYRELVLLNDVPGPVTCQTAASPFVRKRRLFVRELHQAGLF